MLVGLVGLVRLGLHALRACGLPGLRERGRLVPRPQPVRSAAASACLAGATRSARRARRCGARCQRAAPSARAHPGRRPCPAAGSHDRSIRRWERTSEPFFVEEERERRLESLFEADMEAAAGREEAEARRCAGPRLAAAGPGSLAPGAGGGWGVCCGGERGRARALVGRAGVPAVGVLGRPAVWTSAPALPRRATGEEAGSSAMAGRRTLESIGATDSIIEALDMAAHEQGRLREWRQVRGGAARLPLPLPLPLRGCSEAAAGARGADEAVGAALPWQEAGAPRSLSACPAAAAAAAAAQELQANPAARPPAANPLLLGLSPGAYVLKVLAGVRSADLEQALLALPFTDALKLLAYLAAWLKQVGRGGGAGPAGQLLQRPPAAAALPAPRGDAGWADGCDARSATAGRAGGAGVPRGGAAAAPSPRAVCGHPGRAPRAGQAAAAAEGSDAGAPRLVQPAALV